MGTEHYLRSIGSKKESMYSKHGAVEWRGEKKCFVMNFDQLK